MIEQALLFCLDNMKHFLIIFRPKNGTKQYMLSYSAKLNQRAS